MKHVIIVSCFACVAGSAAFFEQRAFATHLNPPLNQGLRLAMPGEGYLEYQVNPVSARFGQEWTGWVDIRHPAMDGTTQTFDPFDYSNRFVNVRTIVATDNAGVEARPGGQAANTGIGFRRDFDYGNKIYMQEGLSIVHTESGALTLNGAGGTPNTAWPISNADLITTFGVGRSANATTANMYYVDRYNPGANGKTLNSANGGVAPRQDASSVGNGAVNNTFAHELGHLLLNGTAQHKEIVGDTAHSGDRTNLMWPDGTQTANSFADVGMLGRHDIVTSNQALRVFGNLGNNNPGFVQRNPIDTRYGNRVDWDFVADAGQLSFNHNNTDDATNVTVTGGNETVGNNVDEVNPPGIDSMFFGINANAPAPADNANHNHTGLGTFKDTPNFAGQTFRYADVISMALRYADYDRDATGGQGLKEGALDYDVVFRAADGTQAAGVPVISFVPGWSDTTNADNYLTRWSSPIDATGMFIFAHLGDNHDYNAQIDAVIVSNVPEPVTVSSLTMLLMFGALRRRRLIA